MTLSRRCAIGSPLGFYQGHPVARRFVFRFYDFCFYNLASVQFGLAQSRLAQGGWR